MIRRTWWIRHLPWYGQINSFIRDETWSGMSPAAVQRWADLEVLAHELGHLFLCEEDGHVGARAIAQADFTDAHFSRKIGLLLESCTPEYEVRNEALTVEVAMGVINHYGFPHMRQARADAWMFAGVEMLAEERRALIGSRRVSVERALKRALASIEAKRIQLE